MVIDWRQCLKHIIDDFLTGDDVGSIAARFHQTLIEMIMDIAHRSGMRRIVLTGGCFQNAFLLEQTVLRLRAEGFEPYWHKSIPTNDGGIAVGQLYASLRGEKFFNQLA